MSTENEIRRRFLRAKYGIFIARTRDLVKITKGYILCDHCNKQVTGNAICFVNTYPIIRKFIHLECNTSGSKIMLKLLKDADREDLI